MTRGERGRDYRGKGCKVFRNNYKGHTDNNKGRVETGEGGREGWGSGEGWGEMAENCT